MTEEQKFQLLKKLINESEKLSPKGYYEPKSKNWRMLVERTFIKIFGETSLEVKKFRILKFHYANLASSKDWKDVGQHDEVFKQDFETTLHYINQFIEESEGETSTESIEINLPVSQPKNKLHKIQWQGTQKELAELFIELESKGWIDKKEPNLIEKYFTQSDSIEQILKPGRDGTYDQVYTKRYKPIFNQIKEYIKKDVKEN